MPSLKRNFAWSSLLTVAGYVFPLLTFPYVTRVLGVDGIGNYQFAVSVIQYFNVFACLGIGTIGIREIAKVNGNQSEMSRIYSNLLLLNLILLKTHIHLLNFLKLQKSIILSLMIMILLSQHMILSIHM